MWRRFRRIIRMNKTISTILGLAIGDALGQPFEFSDSKKIIESGWKGELKGSSYGFKGMWNLKEGQWTDDTKMALALAESLLEKNHFDADHVAGKYIEWVESGDLRGIGKRTQNAIYKMINGTPPMKAGDPSEGRPKPSFKILGDKRSKDEPGLYGVGDYCGNGTVMRCAPIGLFYHNVNDGDDRIKAAEHDATMTHDHADARDSSVALCSMIAMLASGYDSNYIYDVIIDSNWEGTHVRDALKEAENLIKNKSEHAFVDAISLGTRGTAHETLASAWFCFRSYDNYRDAVTASVLAGGDTDTRAAICGALAGTLYGLEGIPKEWVEQVEDTKRLQEIDRRLFYVDINSKE